MIEAKITKNDDMQSWQIVAGDRKLDQKLQITNHFERRVEDFSSSTLLIHETVVVRRVLHFMRISDGRRKNPRTNQFHR